MHVLTPNSFGSPVEPSVDLREFNPCHDPATGRFCAGKGGSKRDSHGQRHRKSDISHIGDLPSVSKDGVIQARTVDEAIEHILAGRDVELASARHVNTVLTKLAAMANDAKARGEKAPNYDLCKVTVPGTNVFCASQFKSKEYPGGIPRIAMPQLGGFPVPGSQADKLPRTSEGGVDGTDAFIAHLKTLGIKASRRSEAAAKLKASQAELVGPKVAGIMTSKTFDPSQGHIFVSRDHYVIDGHHRWAAVVGRDAEDGRLGGSRMNTIRVDAPISRILRIANKWAKDFGIQSVAGPGVKK